MAIATFNFSRNDSDDVDNANSPLFSNIFPEKAKKVCQG